MSTKMFVNLPVKDLNRSIEFFTKLGYNFNPKFTDQNATCMIVSDDNFVMLVTESLFKTFTPKAISDAATTTEAIVSLSADSREAVDEMIKKATEAGATTPNELQDLGWMYQHGFQDLDGHLWEIFHMDMEQMEHMNQNQNTSSEA